MSDPTRHALDRIEQTLNRSGKRRKLGFSTGPIVLASGLILAYQLLVRLIPSLWSEILPGGFGQGAMLSGWSRVIWQVAWFCHLRFPIVLVGTVVLSLVGVLLSRHPTTRPLVGIMAVSTIVLDAAILVIALKTGMDAAGLGQMFG